jgi:hypothetical protein
MRELAPELEYCSRPDVPDETTYVLRSCTNVVAMEATLAVVQSSGLLTLRAWEFHGVWPALKNCFENPVQRVMRGVVMVWVYEWFRAVWAQDRISVVRPDCSLVRAVLDRAMRVLFWPVCTKPEQECAEILALLRDCTARHAHAITVRRVGAEPSRFNSTIRRLDFPPSSTRLRFRTDVSGFDHYGRARSYEYRKNPSGGGVHALVSHGHDRTAAASISARGI